MVVAVAFVTWVAVRDDGNSVSSTPPTSSGATGLGPASDPGIATIGTKAPDFGLSTLDGGTVRLSDLRGTPVVLNFWASWCVPCRDEFPLLRTADRAAHGDYAIVGVNAGDLRGDAKAFARDEHAKWTNGFDADRSVAKLYGVRGLPQTIFIDANGTIVDRLPRAIDRELLDHGIAKAERGAH
ncbi:MAG: TlpA family protein disulfide reductase [Acidimicrobiia bacterium]